MRGRVRSAVLRAAIVAGLLAVVAAPAAPTTYTHGYDVSWPQCRGSRAAHLPSSAAFVVLGLTHGAGHTVNPCLAAQYRWARRHGIPVGAYLVPTYPTARQLAAASSGPFGSCGSDAACRRRNDGAAQASAAVAAMHRARVPAPMVWIDVEFRHTQPWPHDRPANVEVLEGVVRGLEDEHLRYGVYSTAQMWHDITGSWTLRAPNWMPSGGGAGAARATCRDVATPGGTAWLAQYTNEFDEDLTCPSMDAVAGRPGPLWPYRHTTLSPGSSGPAVSAVQRALKVEATGSYDTLTTAAVVRYQVENGLTVDARVDNDDWTALGAFRRYGGHPFLLDWMVAP